MKRMWISLVFGGAVFLMAEGWAEETPVVKTGTSSKEDKSKAWSPVASVEYLLKEQREDGSWCGYIKPAQDQKDSMSIATSAIVCMALLDYWDVNPEKIRAAVERGVSSVVERAKKPTRHWSFIWSQAYPLRLLARVISHPTWKEQTATLTEQAAKMVKRLYGEQGPNGAWGYGVSGQYTSFGTADALLALQEAWAAGIPVDDAKIQEGVKFLKTLRTEDRGYIYIPGAKETWNAMPEGKAQDRSAGRNVLCEWVLLKAGEVNPKNLSAVMEKFTVHKKFLWDCRAYDGSGPLTRNVMLTETGSPYVAFVLYAYQYAGLAMPSLPVERQKKFSSILLEDLMSTKEEDGTWRHRTPTFKGPDHGIGNEVWSTANALIALKGLHAALQ